MRYCNLVVGTWRAGLELVSKGAGSRNGFGGYVCADSRLAPSALVPSGNNLSIGIEKVAVVNCSFEI